MILDELVHATQKRVEKEKTECAMQEMMMLAQKKIITKEEKYPFEEALSGSGMHMICEIKKASPSKGIIAADFPYVDIAKEYEEAGCDAISVLTEPDFFNGNIRYLKEIHESGIKTPLLRKDFTIDSYMIYQAKVNGASAILLICAILRDEQIREYLRLADSLGLSAIVEAHDEKEIERALAAGARIIGVNNRNLKDFTIDMNNSIRLRKMVPSDRIFVAESGIQNKEDVERLYQAGINAVLIGETFMKARNKKEVMQQFHCGINVN